MPRQPVGDETVTLDLPPRALDDIDAAVDGGLYDDREHALRDAVLGFFGGYEEPDSTASSIPSR